MSGGAIRSGMVVAPASRRESGDASFRENHFRFFFPALSAAAVSSAFSASSSYHPQHIEYPVRETKMLGGVFIDELVEQFQNKIVRIFRL